MTSVAGAAIPGPAISPSADGEGGAAIPTVGISPARALTVNVRVNRNATKNCLKFFMLSPEDKLCGDCWNDSPISKLPNAGIITLVEVIPVN
jgi:hypothetical protein